MAAAAAVLSSNGEMGPRVTRSKEEKRRGRREKRIIELEIEEMMT